MVHVEKVQGFNWKSENQLTTRLSLHICYGRQKVEQEGLNLMLVGAIRRLLAHSIRMDNIGNLNLVRNLQLLSHPIPVDLSK